MQKIFSQKLRFKDDEGNAFPDWEVKKLGEISTKSNVKNKDNAIVNVFTNSAIYGIVNQTDFFDKEIANQNNLLGYYLVEKNDFIYNPRISTSAPVGPLKRNHLESGIMSPLYSIIKIKYGNLDYLERYFETTYWHKYMKSVANFGARFDRMNITNIDLLKMPIPYPCIEEQTKIANFLSAIDDKITNCELLIINAEKYKKGLLQQMFV